MTFSLPEKKTVPEHQADAYLSQANPVSGTLYTVLDTTKNVRIITATCSITWATTQPTLLQIIITIDGKSLIYTVSNPVSASWYELEIMGLYNEANQSLATDKDDSRKRAFFIEGRSVKVEVAITWATTQPTPLQCRVKYAKY